MEKIWAERALLPEGWAENVCVTVDQGRISGVEIGVTGGPRVGLLLPAMANLHSHAFQRAMAGLSEAKGPEPRDTFWTWRQIMYRFLDLLTPEDVEAIAALVQIEMLEAAGIKDVKGTEKDYGVGMGIHEMGTARMGRDPRTSVLNGNNQIWDAPNVYVTDGACMTSSACVNPSLTYMALTARASAHAVDSLKNGDI